MCGLRRLECSRPLHLRHSTPRRCTPAFATLYWCTATHIRTPHQTIPSQLTTHSNTVQCIPYIQHDTSPPACRLTPPYRVGAICCWPAAHTRPLTRRLLHTQHSLTLPHERSTESDATSLRYSCSSSLGYTVPRRVTASTLSPAVGLLSTSLNHHH